MSNLEGKFFICMLHVQLIPQVANMSNLRLTCCESFQPTNHLQIHSEINPSLGSFSMRYYQIYLHLHTSIHSYHLDNY